MINRSKGMFAMLAAGTIWGLSPIYYKIIAHVPPLEVLAHRAIFSFFIFLILLLLQGRSRELLRVLVAAPRKLATTVLAAFLIGTNWLIFIFAIQIERTTEASLGYYLFPLLAVFLGSVFLKERLTIPQWISVGMCAAAVLYLSIILGDFPLLALVLASTFAVYGLIKKHVSEGAVLSVAAESLALTPFAIVWLVGVHVFAWPDISGRVGGYFGHELLATVMLASSGLITALPLALMSYATKRLRYSEGGFLLYTNPTLQFLVATLIFKESFTAADLVAFVMIWIALLVFSFEGKINSVLRGVLR